jgi:putative tricarboxylic transport membrane protein
MIMVYILAVRRGYPTEPRATLCQIGRGFFVSFPALMTPAVIVLGIFSGYFSPTEAAAVTVIYAIFMLLIFGTLANLAISKALLPQYARIAMIPPHFVLPTVVALAILGTYATSNSVTDVWMLMLAGVFGVLLRMFGIPIPALALGFILGPGLERALRQALLLGQNDWTYLVQSQLAVGTYVVGTLVVVLFFWATRKG